jgi:hypothetical protein
MENGRMLGGTMIPSSWIGVSVDYHNVDITALGAALLSL